MVELLRSIKLQPPAGFFVATIKPNKIKEKKNE
jgi:hypothetical protein